MPNLTQYWWERRQECQPPVVLIFSTAIPEINIAFSYYVITEVIPNLRNERQELLKTSDKLREKLFSLGLKTMGSSHIVPVILGENKIAVEASKELINNGYYLLPIRHPTVAQNTARVRISLRADISYGEIEEIPDLINKAVKSDF